MAESLYQLLAASAERYPDRTAVDFAGQRMTYRALREGADRMASLLAEFGAEPGRQVAFCFRKSIDALIALFGIIRTGAAYVPLDPTWPAGRCAMICEDAGIALWVGAAAPPPPVRVQTAITAAPAEGTVPLSAWRDSSPIGGEPPAPNGGVANVLFTSGSSGRPKGVRITTRSLLHFSMWAVDAFGVCPDDRLANHAPYNFDLSTLDIFAAVRAGAAVVPVPERVKMFPFEMARYIAEQKISVWYSVPSALMMMQQRGKLAEHDMSALRHVIFAGEVMPKPALRAIARDLPGAALTNLYGPTETNACTYHRVTPEDLASDDAVPIGRPISDTRVWIVDEALRPVGGSESGAQGVSASAGELLVAGPTVTAGYLGDAELTAGRLVPAPGGDGVAYRTGDRVRVRRDGALMFEGRIDRMIKSRGHRIEPGEIEAALAGHPGVQEAAVVALPDPVFGSRIKACVAPRAGRTLTDAELIAHCRERLPPYMVPDVWQYYERLPRTDREKVDLSLLSV